jgi:hypothetical protein
MERVRRKKTPAGLLRPASSILPAWPALRKPRVIFRLKAEATRESSRAQNTNFTVA